MAATPSHSKLLNNAAQEILAPEGVFQKGRSRMWIDDHGWWIVNIEFQPSDFSKGSYLNVGAMWLWDEKDYFSFDTSSRLRPWVKYLSDEQFAPEARKLARTALGEMLAFRAQFASIDLAAKFLWRQRQLYPGNPWTVFHAAVSLGCVGKISKARACFQEIEAFEAEHDWHRKLKDAARRYATVLNDREAFLGRARETISKTRGLLKLPERTDAGL